MAEFIMVGCDLHDKTLLLKLARGREAAEKITLRNTPGRPHSADGAVA